MELILNMIAHPETVFRQVRGRWDRARMHRFLLSLCASGLLSLLLAFERRVNLLQLVILFALSYFALLFLVQLKAMWTQFLAARRGAEGKVLDLSFLLVLSLLPLHLLLPAALLARGLILPAWIAALLWSGWLWFKAVQVHTRLPRAQSFSVAFAPAALLSLGGFLLLAAALLSLANLSGIQGN